MPWPEGGTSMSRRLYGNTAVSQSHQSLTDDRYRDLRRPRKVIFFCNGNRYFKGKKLNITPHRYLSFNDLLNDLTGKLPANVSLPYGVRQIYTPVGGRKIRDIDDLKDGSSYVVAGFETFRSIKYGNDSQAPWNSGKGATRELPSLSSRVEYGYKNGVNSFYNRGGFHPARHSVRNSYPTQRSVLPTNGSDRTANILSHSDSSSMKPKVVTVIRNGNHPRATVKILLNRRSVQSFEQLVSDISESFGSSKNKSAKVKRLFTVSGREVNSISDFFRSDDVFIAVGSEGINAKDVQEIVEELYPGNPYAQNLLREWEKNKKRRPTMRYSRAAVTSHADDDKRDSGYGDDTPDSHNEAGQHKVDVPASSPVLPKIDTGKNGNPLTNKERDLKHRMEKEHNNAVNDNRERARVRMKKKLDREKRALDEERRKKAPLPNIAERPNAHVATNSENVGDSHVDKENEGQPQGSPDEGQASPRRPPAEKPKRSPSSNNNINNNNNIVKSADPEGETEVIVGHKEKSNKLDVENNNNNKKASDLRKSPAKNNTEGQPNEKVAQTSTKVDNGSENKKKSGSRLNLKKSKLERQVTNVTRVLAKYEVGRTLGDGNFAIVKQCRYKPTSTDYAMKVIDKSKLKGKEHMIENEIAIMKACNHTNIVKLVEEFETADEIYLIMELIKGGDLFDAITQSVKFGEQQAASMAKDLANALFYLHSRSIVHRDLKPENLMVCRNKDGSITLKLADFGLAMEVKGNIYTVCGTPTYVAPEILTEIGYGLEVDMWAVGVITYILLCGFPPFRSPDRKQTELFEYIKAGEYEFLSPYWDNTSADAKDLISQLLIVDKSRRYSAIDVLCHPWIISFGGMMQLPDNLEEYRRNLRSELDAQAKVNLESWRTNKT